MTSCVIYTRFSPRRNAEESQSNETQFQLCMDYATSQGWTFKSWHKDEAISGDVDMVDRPGLVEAVGALRKGDVLLVWRRDRIARSVLVAEYTRRKVDAAGAKIVAVEGDVDGEGPEVTLVRQVLDAVAEYERKLIGARTRSHLRTQQRSGKRVSKIPPYGYMPDPSDPTRLVEDPREQPAVRRVLELAGQGLTYSKIAYRLRKELPTLCRGEKWSPHTVKKIMERAR
jgi:site-specific DNA recombinase